MDSRINSDILPFHFRTNKDEKIKATRAGDEVNRKALNDSQRGGLERCLYMSDHAGWHEAQA